MFCMFIFFKYALVKILQNQIYQSITKFSIDL